LTENMRLSGLRRSLTATSSAVQILNCEKQERYASFLLDLSRNRQSEHLYILDTNSMDTSLCKVGLPLLDYFDISSQDAAVAWLYPNGTFDADIALNSVILASTNNAVDRWNDIIQSLNQEEIRHYFSRDFFNEVDDENDTLKRMLN